MPADLFVGVVTHPSTRYPEAAGDSGLAHRLARLLNDSGLATQVEIHATDAWNPDLLTIDRAMIERSVSGELDVEARWRMLHSPRTPKAAMSGFMAARRFYRTRKYLPRGRAIDSSHPGFRMVRRLVNIELAHLSLLRTARSRGDRWALILEDDATGQPKAAANVLAALMARAGVARAPLYANVSQSFDEGRLRIEGHLTDIGGLPDDQEPTRILAADQPVTNTVCAVLYRGNFLDPLIDALDHVPMDPVIPIDWKLNSALMSLHQQGVITKGDCWTLRPAPILQGSMHP